MNVDGLAFSLYACKITLEYQMQFKTFRSPTNGSGLAYMNTNQPTNSTSLIIRDNTVLQKLVHVCGFPHKVNAQGCRF